jgi:hypothetical protein
MIFDQQNMIIAIQLNNIFSVFSLGAVTGEGHQGPLCWPAGWLGRWDLRIGNRQKILDQAFLWSPELRGPKIYINDFNNMDVDLGQFWDVEFKSHEIFQIKPKARPILVEIFLVKKP